jgi:DNA polymerase-3 subunit delta'
MIRENFIFNIRQKELNYMTSDESGFSEKFSPFINERNICQFLSELELAERHIERNGQAKIILFDLALKITMLLKM